MLEKLLLVSPGLRGTSMLPLVRIPPWGQARLRHGGSNRDVVKRILDLKLAEKYILGRYGACRVQPRPAKRLADLFLSPVSEGTENHSASPRGFCWSHILARCLPAAARHMHHLVWGFSGFPSKGFGFWFSEGPVLYWDHRSWILSRLPVHSPVLGWTTRWVCQTSCKPKPQSLNRWNPQAPEDRWNAEVALQSKRPGLGIGTCFRDTCPKGVWCLL